MDLKTWFKENPYEEHDLAQGSPEWHAFRYEYRGASEASAMLGISKKTKRDELLYMKHTRTPKEFSDWVQENVLDRGHILEASARPIVESQLGTKLYPIVCSRGRISASCDGLNMAGTTGWEHKQWNAQLAAAVLAKELPDEFMAQPQQCLLVTGAEKWIFTVSDGTKENMVSMEILPDEAWFSRIIAGLEQFEKDLKNYVPQEIIEPPKPDPIKDLPAVIINASGGLSVCNLDEVTPLFELFINNAKTELVTDEDFANGEETAKKSRSTAKTLKMKAKEVIDQIATVGDAVRTLELYAEKFDKLGLTLEKAVKDQKEAIKAKIMAEARQAYSMHISALEDEIRPIQIIGIAPDFAGAMKNKRTLASLHDSVNTELANLKIEADSIAKDIRAKLAWIKQHADDYRFLLNDLQQIIYKDHDDFKLLVTSRIDAHKKSEADKREAERKRIQEEEESKARAKVQVEQEPAKPALDPEQPAGAVIPPQNTATHKAKAQAAVVESQDDISLFLAGLNAPDKTKQTIRAYLVEFVKFQAIQRGMESIAA